MFGDALRSPEPPRRRAPLRAIFVWGLTAVLLAPGARADDKSELKEARAKFQQGNELEQAKQYSEALALFRDVGQTKMTPQVRYHIAFCQEKLGELVGALGGYRLALKAAEGLPDSFQNTVREAITSLESRVPKLKIVRGKGAQAAKIEVDGTVLGTALVGKENPINPGGHIITASAPGYRKFKVTVDIAEKQLKTVSVALEEISEEEKRREKERVVYINGAPAAQPGPVVLPWVIGGVGVASLIVSGIFLGLRQSALSTLDEQCPSRANCPASLKGDFDSATTSNIVFQVAGGVGIVGIGVGLTLYFVQGRKPTEPGNKALHGVQFRGSAPGADVAGFSLAQSF